MRTATPTAMPTVTTGLDRLLADPDLLPARRIALATNATGLTADLRRGVDALRERGFTVTALLAPEHGLHGTAQAGRSEGTGNDPATGIPIVDTYELPAADLDAAIAATGPEAVVFDMQDVGTRYWTYTSTMLDCMAAAARTGVPFAVLDRPNPLGGTTVEGPGLDPAYRSFVGRLDIPLRHGLTAGEIARLAALRSAGTSTPLPDPVVVTVGGWKDRSPGACHPFVPPSPNLPTADTALVYPATGLVEGVNASEGRGTTRPFETVGAPYVDDRLLPLLREQELPGVLWRETWFRPVFHMYAGQVLRGVSLHVTDAAAFAPVRTGLTLLWALAGLYPDELRVLPRGSGTPASEQGCALDRLWGSDTLRRALEEGRDPRSLSGPATTVHATYPAALFTSGEATEEATQAAREKATEEAREGACAP
ncbi:exo-beta-N-acetylmuramidase NamZ domain-containing protein [Streptacidiphilus sp. MAP5-3]|uniref:exo-beta-N-acetylmuramidase NamZ family protein n=1 Tax=unclassified Streptacidiphilus TaxID=2643834 RepID=UPI0035114E59